ncbi:MAG: redox-regulated ATPase YchF [Planctomycetes bacterium]|jgi:GTP-binding protein YchF|nr:redox-regulated ATPase YchF [Planctomycetota bacterium]
MSVACGIVGLPNIGKTTLFNAATGSGAERANYAFSTVEPNVAEVDVPDGRLEVIHGFIETDKVVPARVRIVDIAGLAEGASRGEGIGNKFLGHIKETDALMHVVQCFEKGEVAREKPVDPRGDIEVLELELAMADLETVARNADRVAKKARTGDKEAIFQGEVFARAKALLEEGKQLRSEAWKLDELEALRPLFLLTTKPVLYVANVGDDGSQANAKVVAEHAASVVSASIAVCGDIECELNSMDDEDRAMFMEELGIAELALPRLLQATYEVLGLQTFFTAGEKEIKAWTISSGDTGPVAAGKIHSDFEKGYVRAEVYGVDDLVDHENEVAIRAAGKLRIEGRDYVLKEGDVCHFLVNR